MAALPNHPLQEATGRAAPIPPAQLYGKSPQPGAARIERSVSLPEGVGSPGNGSERGTDGRRWQEMESGPRGKPWVLPAAFLLSLLLHLLLLWILGSEASFFVALAPPIQRQEPLRFEFVEAPESAEPVEAEVWSDKNRRAQSPEPSAAERPELRSQEAAVPSQAARVQPSRPPSPQPPSRPRPKEKAPEPERPETEARGRPLEGRETAVAKSSESREPAPQPELQSTFDRQFEKLHRQSSASLLAPRPIESSRGGDVPSSVVAFDTQAHDLGPYGRILYVRTKAAWFIPRAARDFAKGITELKFSITRDGVIKDLRVHESSGWPSLDVAALNAVRGAAPLPPLPEGVPEEQVGVTFRFYYNVPMP